MAEGRERSEWNRAAAIIVRVHNVHASKESEMIKFENIHPYFISRQITKQQQGPKEEDMKLLQRAIEGMNGSRTD